MGEAAVKTDTIIERDTEAFNAKDTFSAADLIAHAAKKSGRGALSIGREMIKYSRSKARLKPAEYVMYEFYNREKYSADARAAFISGAMHGKIVYQFNDYGWFEAAGDKWLSAMFLAADNTPQPDTIAVIDQGARAYHGTRKLSTPQAVRDFLTAQDMPLFCKYNNGRWSLGANIITAADDSHIHMRGKAPITYDAFFQSYIGTHTFLIQRIVENHSFRKEYTPTTATVRELNARVAALHHPVKYQTQDIAITDDGPVEIEFNWGGAFELPQIAKGEGFLTREIRDAFRSFGSTKV